MTGAGEAEEAVGASPVGAKGAVNGRAAGPREPRGLKSWSVQAPRRAGRRGQRGSEGRSALFGLLVVTTSIAYITVPIHTIHKNKYNNLITKH